MSLGTRLRQTRTLQALSESEVAARSGLTAAYVAEVEAGWKVPSHEELERWASALQVPFYRLFFTDPPTVQPPRLSPRAGIDEAVQTKRRSIFRALARFEEQAVSALLGRDSAPDETDR